VFAPNHPLRQAVTALAIGNIGKQRDAKTGEHARFEISDFEQLPIRDSR
jgi:hypothetical protein